MDLLVLFELDCDGIRMIVTVVLINKERYNM